MPLTEVIDIVLYPLGIRIEGVPFFFPWHDRGIDTIAKKDGIVPPTGEELCHVLMSKNKIPETGLSAQILRW
jgi:hypothetical protein